MQYTSSTNPNSASRSDDYAARSYQSPREALLADAALQACGTTSAALVSRMAGRIDAQLATRRQEALIVCAYYQGVEILHVGGGRVRKPGGRCSSHWRPAGPSDLLACFSVSKGMAAAALLALIDAGALSYEMPAADLWPQLSRTASVRDIASHRGEVPLLCSCLISLIWPLLLGPWIWPATWSVMCRLVAWANRRAAARLGLHATYHQISFSFLIGTFIERAAMRPFGAAVCASVAERLGLMGGGEGANPRGFYLGEVPISADPRIVRVESPPCGSSRLRPSKEAAEVAPAEGGVVCWVLRHVVAPIEAWLICGVANRPAWRRLKLPSSNGFFTAQAIARVFGALANGGRVRVGVGGEGGKESEWAQVRPACPPTLP